MSSSSSTSSTASSESSRCVSPSTRKYRSLSPFVTPDKRLDTRKYSGFLKDCDILELHYYQNSFNLMSVKYPESIRKDAEKEIKKTKKEKWVKAVIYAFSALIVFLVVLQVIGE